MKLLWFVQISEPQKQTWYVAADTAAEAIAKLGGLPPETILTRIERVATTTTDGVWRVLDA